jgi:hypothetical protein
VQADLAAVPAVQALSAQVPAVQSRDAVGPAVQSCDAAAPGAQSVIPGRTQGPTVQKPIAPHTTPPATELPAEQTPDPLAISPKGTRMGGSYFDFPLVFWFDIINTSLSECIYISYPKTTPPHLTFSIGQFQYKYIRTK